MRQPLLTIECILVVCIRRRASQSASHLGDRHQPLNSVQSSIVGRNKYLRGAESHFCKTTKCRGQSSGTALRLWSVKRNDEKKAVLKEKYNNWALAIDHETMSSEHRSLLYYLRVRTHIYFRHNPFVVRHFNEEVRKNKHLFFFSVLLTKGWHRMRNKRQFRIRMDNRDNGDNCPQHSHDD